MKELKNIILSFILFWVLGCQNKENDIKFIKNKELFYKVNETIELIEVKLGNGCKYVSIKLLNDKEGHEYIKVQSEPELNQSKIFYQENYRGKLIVVYEAADSLLNKYFDEKYKAISEKKELDSKIDIYDPIGYIFEVTPKGIIIIETIGLKAPEEIESYSPFKVDFILPKPR